MRLTVVGCSPAWPNPGGAQSGYLVEEDGRRLLLDCGPGVLSRLREHERWPRVDAIAITHLHLDHWGDLVPWTYGIRAGVAGADATPELWLPPGGAQKLSALSRVGGDAVVETFSPREYGDAPFRAAGFELTPVPLPHYGSGSFGFRVAGVAATIAYSSDAGPTSALARLARDADLFLCEATLAAPESGRQGHLTADDAVAAFRESAARRLLVVHRPDELPLPDGVERAHDGLVVDL